MADFKLDWLEELTHNMKVLLNDGSSLFLVSGLKKIGTSSINVYKYKCLFLSHLVRTWLFLLSLFAMRLPFSPAFRCFWSEWLQIKKTRNQASDAQWQVTLCNHCELQVSTSQHKEHDERGQRERGEQLAEALEPLTPCPPADGFLLCECLVRIRNSGKRAEEPESTARLSISAKLASAAAAALMWCWEYVSF